MAQTICGIVNAGYLPASFNGVPFDAVEVSSAHGRRGAEGEFPFGENTAYADLGRRIRTYSLSGKIQSDGFLGIATALIAACEVPGPGILVHPTRGIISAACKSLKVSDKIEDEAGITYVELEFVEGNAWPNGLSIVGSVLGFILSGIITASRDSFKAHYAPRKAPVSRRVLIVGTATLAVAQIRDEYLRVIASSTTTERYHILSDMNEVVDNPALLIDPEVADRAIALGINALALELSGVEKMAAMKRLANANANVPALPATLGGASQNAVYSHVRTIAAAYMAQGAGEATFKRRAEVYDAIDLVSTILDDEAVIANQNCYNALYDAIAQFELDVQTTLYARAYSVPGLVDYNFSGGVHPLVAAYSIFNDAKRHRELEQGNIVNSTGRIGPVVTAANAG